MLVIEIDVCCSVFQRRTIMGTFRVCSFIECGVFTMLSLLTVISGVGSAGDDYELSRQMISARAESSGGEYELVVKVGAADKAKMSGGEYEMVVSLEPGPPVGDITLKAFADFAAQWLGTEGSFTADLDGDNDVDLADLSIFLEKWLEGYPSDWHL